MLTVIGTENCMWCAKVKDLLSDHKIPFDVLTVPNKLSALEFHQLAEDYGMSKTVPKIFDGKKLIGGYDDLLDWIENHSGGYGENF